MMNKRDRITYLIERLKKKRISQDDFEEAVRRLNVVLKDENVTWLHMNMGNVPLISAFDWRTTPYSYEYWRGLSQLPERKPPKKAIPF